MDQFSPFTRRLVALGILFLFVWAVTNFMILPLSGLTASSLDRLADARFRLARLEQIRDRPVSPPGDTPDGELFFTAASREAAVDFLSSTVRDLAVRTGVRIDALSPGGSDPNRPRLIVIDLTLSGEQGAMLSFINELERGPPAHRLRNWTLMSSASTEVRAQLSDDAPRLPVPAPTSAAPIELRFTGQLLGVWSRTP